MQLPRSLFWIMILIPLVQINAQGIKITLNPEPGFNYKTELTSSISFIQEFMGISYRTDTRIVNVINTKVSELSSDSGFHMKSNYSQIDFSMKSQILDIEMSSQSNDSTNPMNVMMKSLIGQQFTQLVSSKAEILEIKGLDEIIYHQIQKLNLPEDQINEFKKNFLDSFGEKAIKDYNVQNFIFYPDELKSSGDDWFRSLTISPYGIPMHLLVNVKLKEVSKDYAVFISEGTLAARRTDINSTRNDNSSSYDLTGTQVSEVRINLKNGLIINSITTQFIQGKVNTVDSNFPGEVIELPIRIESRTTSVVK